MKECPNCRVPMKENVKYGVVIDACEQCQGVWLDAGELEKVVVLVKEVYSSADNVHSPTEYRNGRKDDDHHNHHERDHDHHHKGHSASGHSRKKNRLAELLEIFG